MNPTIPPDPAIDEIREIRHRISTRCDHDPAKLVAYLMQYQEQFRDRLIYDPKENHVDQQAVQLDTEPNGGSGDCQSVLNS
jgi:hypothetical protein